MKDGFTEFETNYACLDEFNMYVNGCSFPRKVDYHLHKDKFSVESFTITEGDSNLPMGPYLGDIKEMPFTEATYITPKDKEAGQRIDFGIAVYPNHTVILKVFGKWRGDRRFKRKHAPLVFDQAKGISHDAFIEWLGEISEYEVCYFYISLIFIYKCRMTWVSGILGLRTMLVHI
jgi:hypothetical protein